MEDGGSVAGSLNRLVPRRNLRGFLATTYECNIDRNGTDISAFKMNIIDGKLIVNMNLPSKKRYL